MLAIPLPSSSCCGPMLSSCPWSLIPTTLLRWSATLRCESCFVSSRVLGEELLTDFSAQAARSLSHYACFKIIFRFKNVRVMNAGLWGRHATIKMTGDHGNWGRVS